MVVDYLYLTLRECLATEPFPLIESRPHVLTSNRKPRAGAAQTDARAPGAVPGGPVASH